MHFLPPEDTSLGWSAIFVLDLSSVALLAVGCRDRLSSHNVYTRLLARMPSVHYWDFCFTGYMVQHLGLLEKYWGLRSVLEGFNTIFYIRCFWSMIQSFRWTWFALSTRTGLEVLYRPFGFLISCFQVFDLLQPHCHLGGILGFSVWKGDPKFLEGLLLYCKRCMGKSYPCLLLL